MTLSVRSASLGMGGGRIQFRDHLAAVEKPLAVLAIACPHRIENANHHPLLLCIDRHIQFGHAATRHRAGN